MFTISKKETILLFNFCPQLLVSKCSFGRSPVNYEAKDINIPSNLFIWSNIINTKLCTRICIKFHIAIHMAISGNTHYKSCKLKLNDIHCHMYYLIRFGINYRILCLIILVIVLRFEIEVGLIYRYLYIFVAGFFSFFFFLFSFSR